MANVKVAVRVRPLNKRELENGAKVIVELKDDIIRIKNPKIPENSEVDSREKFKRFVFDYLFSSSSSSSEDHNASQEEIFQELGAEIMDAIFDGYNACVLAYGQSGSGKTYTMMGQENEVGLIPRLCKALFARLDDANGKITFHIDVSFLEIYNEKVRDLLQPSVNKKKTSTLKVREHPKLGTYVQDLSRHKVNDYQTVLALIEKGNDQRSNAVTENHQRSSRSHAIFTINFTQAKLDADLPSEIISKIHLVDLAGSERAGSTFNKVRLKESSNINKSLVTLGNVISALADKSLSTWSLDSIGSSYSINSSASESVATSPICSPRRMRHPFVPYRDSVLTWLLKDCLGGNSKTLMITTVSPASTCYNETIGTLRYAQRTKCIVNRPVVNEDPNVKLIRQLRAEIYRLRKLLAAARINNILPSTVDENSITEILNQNENKAKVLTKSWFAKWQYSLNIIEDSGQCFNEQNSEFIVNSFLPHLIVLDNHILSTGIHIYPLKQGKTIINKVSNLSEEFHDANDLTEYCNIFFDGQTVTLAPSNKHLCQINGKNVNDAVQLRQADIIKLGNNYTLRFNHPSEVQKLKTEWPNNMKFYDTNFSPAQVLPSGEEASPFYQMSLFDREKKENNFQDMNDIYTNTIENELNSVDDDCNESLETETSPPQSSSTFKIFNSTGEHNIEAEKVLNKKNLECNSEHLIFSYAIDYVPPPLSRDILDSCVCAAEEASGLPAVNNSEATCNHIGNFCDIYSHSLTNDQSHLCCAKCQSASHLRSNCRTLSNVERITDEINPSVSIFSREIDDSISTTCETRTTSVDHFHHSRADLNKENLPHRSKNSFSHQLCNINKCHKEWNHPCHVNNHLTYHINNGNDVEICSSNGLKQCTVNDVLINMPAMVDSSDSGIACCHNSELVQVGGKCHNSIDQNVWHSYFYNSNVVNSRSSMPFAYKEFHQETESVTSLLSEDYSESSSCKSLSHNCQFGSQASAVNSRPNTAPAAIRQTSHDQLMQRLNKRVFSEPNIPDVTCCASQDTISCHHGKSSNIKNKKIKRTPNGLIAYDKTTNNLIHAKIKRRILNQCLSQAIKTICAIISRQKIKTKKYHRKRNKILCVKPKVKFWHKDPQKHWNFSSKLRTALVRAYLKNALLGIKKFSGLKRTKILRNPKRLDSKKKNFVLFDSNINRSPIKKKEIYTFNDNSHTYIESSHLEKDNTFNSELLTDVKNFVNFAKDITDSQHIIKVLENTNNLKSSKSEFGHNDAVEQDDCSNIFSHSLSSSSDKTITVSSDEQALTIIVEDSDITCKDSPVSSPEKKTFVSTISIESLISENNQSSIENVDYKEECKLNLNLSTKASSDKNTNLVNKNWSHAYSQDDTNAEVQQPVLIFSDSNLNPTIKESVNDERDSFSSTSSNKIARSFSPVPCFSLESDDISNISRKEIEIVPLSASAAVDSSKLLNVSPIADGGELKRSLSNTDIQRSLQTEMTPTETPAVDLTFCPSISHAPKIRTNSWPEPSQLSLEQLDSEIKDLQEGLKEDLVNEVFINIDEKGIHVDGIDSSFMQSFIENTNDEKLQEQFSEINKNKENTQIWNDVFLSRSELDQDTKQMGTDFFSQSDYIDPQSSLQNMYSSQHISSHHPPKKLVRQGARVSLSVDADQMVESEEDNFYSDDSLDGNNNGASRLLSSKSNQKLKPNIQFVHNSSLVKRERESLEASPVIQNNLPPSLSPTLHRSKERRKSLERLKPIIFNDDSEMNYSDELHAIKETKSTSKINERSSPENKPIGALPQVHIFVSEPCSDENNTANDEESWEIDGSFPTDNVSVAYTDDFESDVDEDDEDDINNSASVAEVKNGGNEDEEDEIEEEISGSVSDEEIYYIPADPANPNWSLYYNSTQSNFKSNVCIENSVPFQESLTPLVERNLSDPLEGEMKTKSVNHLSDDPLNNRQNFPVINCGNIALNSHGRTFTQQITNTTLADDGFFEADGFKQLLTSNSSICNTAYDPDSRQPSSSPFSLSLSASDESSSSSSSSCFDAWEHAGGADILGSVGISNGTDDIFAETLLTPLPPIDMLIDYRMMSPQDRRRLYTIPELSSEYSSTPSESFGLHESISEMESHQPFDKISICDMTEDVSQNLEVTKLFNEASPIENYQSTVNDNNLEDNALKNEFDTKIEIEANIISVKNETDDLRLDDCSLSSQKISQVEPSKEKAVLISNPSKSQSINDIIVFNSNPSDVSHEVNEDCSEPITASEELINDDIAKENNSAIENEQMDTNVTDTSDCRELWKLYKRYSEESEEEEGGDEEKKTKENAPDTDKIESCASSLTNEIVDTNPEPLPLVKELKIEEYCQDKNKIHDNNDIETFQQHEKLGKDLTKQLEGNGIKKESTVVTLGEQIQKSASLSERPIQKGYIIVDQKLNVCSMNENQKNQPEILETSLTGIKYQKNSPTSCAPEVTEHSHQMTSKILEDIDVSDCSKLIQKEPSILNDDINQSEEVTKEKNSVINHGENVDVFKIGNLINEDTQISETYDIDKGRFPKDIQQENLLFKEDLFFPLAFSPNTGIYDTDMRSVGKDRNDGENKTDRKNDFLCRMVFDDNDTDKNVTLSPYDDCEQVESFFVSSNQSDVNVSHLKENRVIHTKRNCDEQSKIQAPDSETNTESCKFKVSGGNLRLVDDPFQLSKQNVPIKKYNSSLSEKTKNFSEKIRLQGYLLQIDHIDFNSAENSNIDNALNEKENDKLSSEKEKLENITEDTRRNREMGNVTCDEALFSNEEEDQVTCCPPTTHSYKVPYNGSLSPTVTPTRFSTDQNNESDWREELQLDIITHSVASPPKTSIEMGGDVTNIPEKGEKTQAIPFHRKNAHTQNDSKRTDFEINDWSNFPWSDSCDCVDVETNARTSEYDAIKIESKNERPENNKTQEYSLINPRAKEWEGINENNYITPNNIILHEKLPFSDCQDIELFFLENELNYKNRKDQPWSYKNWLFQPRLDCCVKGLSQVHSPFELTSSDTDIEKRWENNNFSAHNEADLVANEATVIAALGTSFHTDIFGELNSSFKKPDIIEVDNEKDESVLKNVADGNSSRVTLINEHRFPLENNNHSSALPSYSSRNKRESSITPDSLENVEQQQLTSWSHSVPGQQSLFTVRSSKPVNSGLSLLASSGPRDWGATAFEEFWAASSDSITFVFVGPSLPRSGKSSSDPSAADAFLRHFDDPSDPMPRSASLDCINRRQRCISRVPYALNTRASSMESMIPEDLMSVVEQGRLHGIKSEQETDLSDKRVSMTEVPSLATNNFRHSISVDKVDKAVKKTKKKSVSWGDLSGCGLTVEEGTVRPPLPPPPFTLKPIIKRLDATTVNSFLEKNKLCKENYTDDDVEEDLKKSPLFARIQKKCGAITGAPVIQTNFPSSFALKMPDHVKARMKRSKSEADVEKKSLVFPTSQKEEIEKPKPDLITTLEDRRLCNDDKDNLKIGVEPLSEVNSSSLPSETTIDSNTSPTDLTQLSSLIKEASSVFSQLSQICARNTSSQSTQTHCNNGIKISVTNSSTQTDPLKTELTTVATNTDFSIWEKVPVSMCQSDCILTLLDEKNVLDVSCSSSVIGEFPLGETKISSASLSDPSFTHLPSNDQLSVECNTPHQSSLFPLAAKGSRRTLSRNSSAIEGSKSSWCRRENCLRKELEILIEEKERVLRQLEELYNSGVPGESSPESPGSSESPQYLLTYHSHLQDACIRVSRKLEKMAAQGRPDDALSLSASSSHSFVSNDYYLPFSRGPTENAINGWTTPASSWANLSHTSDESSRSSRIPLGGERRLRPMDYRAQLLDIRRNVVAFSKSPSRSGSGSSVAQASSSPPSTDSVKNSPLPPTERETKRNSRRGSADDLQALLRECRIARAKAQREIELAQAQLNAQKRAVKNLETVLKQKT